MSELTNNIITVPYNFEPRAYQLDFFRAMDKGYKRAFCRWTRRAGKDLTYWQYTIKEALRVVGNYYYVFPTYAQGKKALWEGKTKGQRKYLDYIPPGWGKTNANEMRIELLNGSTIRIVGSENIDSLRGAGPRGVVISEFAWQSMLVIETLEPMLMENEGWMIINSTPQGKNFMYDFEQTILHNKNWYVSEVQSLWPDLPNFYPVITTKELDDKLTSGTITHEQYIEEGTKQTGLAIESLRKQGRTEEYIEQEYGVSYIAGQKGAFYADCVAEARKEGRIGEYCYDKSLYVDTFWDLGITDDTSVWFRQVSGNKLIFIDYFEANNEDPMFYVKMLKEKGYRYRTHWLPHDGAYLNRQTNMTDAKLYSRLLLEAGLSNDVRTAECPRDKLIAINLVRSRFSRYHFNAETCTDGITKLSMYHREFDKKKQIFKPKPAHDWTSHAADAMSTEGLTGDSNELFNQQIQHYITDFDPFGGDTNGQDFDW